MKSIFDPAAAIEVKRRMALLAPETPRLWGKMAPAQMLAHCAGKIFGKIAKRSMLSGRPIGRNMPTEKSFIVRDDRDLNVERQRLAVLIDRFQSGGPDKCTKHPHSFFGIMTPEEWSALNYIHLDHHLKQFGV